MLIDEINLANNEVLQKLLPVIEGQSLLIYERGDLQEIIRHKDFRLIGCMNPGSDIGKKDLPENVRLKFTEIFVTDIEAKNDLQHLVSQKLAHICDSLMSEKVTPFSGAHRAKANRKLSGELRYPAIPFYAKC